ncbi:MAG: superoxide dismutase [Cellulosilyticaceae bacterium]
MFYPFVLEPLPYPYGALEPYIDTRTVTIHHDRHQKTYVDNLNTLIATHPELSSESLESLLSTPTTIPSDIRQQVINQGGGVYNHTFYWENLSPNSTGQPIGDLALAIDQSFGSFDHFKNQFKLAALSNFGSGWTWLVKTPEGSLQIINTANQDTPISLGLNPLMTMDVWEHAYYLKHQNLRGDYIDALWPIINWENAEALYISSN